MESFKEIHADIISIDSEDDQYENDDDQYENDDDQYENEDYQHENEDYQYENDDNLFESDDNQFENDEMSSSTFLDRSLLRNFADKIPLQLAAAIYIIQNSARSSQKFNDDLYNKACDIILRSIDSPSHASNVSHCFFFIKDLDFSNLNKQFISFLLYLLDALAIQNDFTLIPVVPFEAIYFFYFSSFIIKQLFLLFDRFSQYLPLYLFPSCKICKILFNHFLSSDLLHFKYLQNLLSHPASEHALVNVYIFGIEHAIIKSQEFPKIINEICAINTNFPSNFYNNFDYSSKVIIFSLLLQYFDPKFYIIDLFELVETVEPQVISLALGFIKLLVEQPEYINYFSPDDIEDLKDMAITCLNYPSHDQKILNLFMKHNQYINDLLGSLMDIQLGDS